jgi:glyoxylase-like metal-dependent hydrolase (beta-lactamase superfamily II)
LATIHSEKKIIESRRNAVKSLLYGTAVAISAAACASQCLAAAQPRLVTVAAGVYALLGSGGAVTPENGGRIANVAFVVGPLGVVVVDTGSSYREGEEIIAAIRSISNLPIRLAILTHPGAEAIFGAAAFQAHGIPVLAHRRGAELMVARCDTCLRNLKVVLGDDAMASTRVVKPDRLIGGNVRLALIGRPLRLIASEWSSAPGTIAVFDERTSTLMAGSEVSIDRIPDVRDADLNAWRDTLAQIEALKCRHLVPGYGPIGDCADVGVFVHYLIELERHVEALMNEGVSLGELRDRCGLPEFASWDQYETLHPENANRTYLRLERSQFK